MKKITFILSITLTLSAFAQVPNYVPTYGLVGWWPFNGNANDESGNGNNGTVNGATLTTDRFGNINCAYSFNGSNNNIVLNSINSSNGISFSYWVNSSISNSGIVLVQNNISNSSQTAFSSDFGANNNNPFSDITVGHSGGNCSILGNLESISTSSLNYLNQWFNITGVIQSNGLTSLFINGNLIQSSNIGSTYLVCNSNTSLRIAGPWWNNDGRYFSGFIDDIGIWNRALTPQEVAALFNGCQQSISVQPQSQMASFNDNVQFTAASSDPNATYQWQTNLGLGFQNLTDAGQYSGSSTNTLNVSNVTLSNNNQQFRCIIASGSCSDTSDVALLTVVNNVGLVEQNQMQLFVYPNPTSSIITIENPQGLISSFLVVDAQGREVHSGTLNITTTLNLHAFPKGVYTILFENNALREMKVVKE
jgi:hypothetical protein